MNATTNAASVAEKVCLAVAELPDRDSPEDWPEAMLVTADELHQIVIEALASAPQQPVVANPQIDGNTVYVLNANGTSETIRVIRGLPRA